MGGRVMSDIKQRLRDYGSRLTAEAADRIEAIEQRVNESELQEISTVGQLQSTLEENAALRQQLADKTAECEGLREDAERLNWIAGEYAQVDTFAMPTGGDDADVGWTLKQWHMGESIPRLIHRHYKDDLRAAIDAARKEG